MKKFILPLVFIFTALTSHLALANNQCSIELDASVKINSTSIEFYEEDHSHYKIINDEVLLVNGEKVTLSAKQQRLVTQYSHSIRDVIPKVKHLAFDAIALASEGVTVAFDELLGENNQVTDELTTELTSLHQQVEQKLSIEQGITLNDKGADSDALLGDEFEDEIERIVENTVKKSIGSLLVAVGQEMLTTGGLEAFETKMENFGQLIEEEMNERTAVIEQQSDELCLSFKKIDELEGELQKSIDLIADIDVINTAS